MDKQTEDQFIEMNNISNSYIEEVVKPLLPNAEKGGVLSDVVSVLKEITISL